MKHFNFFTNRVVKSFRGLALVAFVLLGVSSLSAASQAYTFTAKNWTATPTNWTSGKDGLGFVNNGIQVTTGVTGAKGTSPISFDNVGDVVVTYCTNASAGVGTIKVSVGANVIATTAVTKTGGTTPRTLTFPGGGTYSGNITIEVATTTNSIYIIGTTINYTPAASCTTNATVSTGAESSVTTSSATLTCSGGITDFGANCTISEYGFVYGTSANPTTSNTKAQVGTTYVTPSTSFNTGISSLAASTLYYVRPYAINGNGTAYGTQFSFTTSSPSCSALGTPSVTATPGNTSAQLSWGAVANASSYTLVWNGGAAETNVTSPITKTGLTNGTSYSYSVMAVGDGTTYCATNTAATGNVTPNCTSISPTITYGAYSVLVGSTIAAPTIGGNTGSGTVTYSSSNTGVLTVNSSTGVVTGVASGTATVTASVASSGNYCSGSIVSSTITVNIPAYTVTFNAGSGSCGTASLTEASGGAGVTLPTASPSVGCAAETPAWVFSGWATASQTETTSAPTLYAASATYNPSANVTLYAVYTQTTGSGSTDATLTNNEIKAGTANGSYAIITPISSTSGSWNGRAIVNTTTGYVQINKNASNYYVQSPTFAGGITSVTINTNNTTSSGRIFYLCSSNGTAQPTSGDLGEGSIPAVNGSATITVTGAPTSFYIYSNGAAYIASVTVTYGSGSTTYNSNPICVVCDANTLALTSTTQTINIDGTGYADYNVSTLITSKNGNGAVTYSVTPAAAIIDENTGEFTTDTPGTYYVTVLQALGSEGSPICAKTVKDTIVVLAQPVVTIVDVTPLTFTANCGEASVAQSVSVSGYNLTANMTATAPTNFLVSSNNSTFGATATFTQASGTASGTLYIKANPPAASTNSISGNVSLTSTDATTRTLAVSATVSCTPVHIYFNDKGSVIADSTEYVGGTVTFPANPSCTDTDYTFDGWYTATLNDAASYTKVTAPYTVTGETTLYAVYKHTSGGASSTSNLTSTIVGGLEAMAYTSTYTKDVDSKTWTFTGCYRLSSGDNLQMNSTATRYIQTPDMGSEITSITINVKRSAASNIGIYTTSGTLIKSIAVTTAAADYTETISGYNQVRIYNSTTGVTNFYSVSVTAGPAATYTTNPLCCPNKLTTPTNFAATAGDTQAGLSWDAVSNATSYNIECTTNPAKSVTGVTGTSTTITGLTNCTAYSFKITAIGDGVDYCASPASSAVSATPQSAVLTATFDAGTNGTCGTASLTNTCLSNDITLPSATPSVGFAFDGWQVDGTGTVYLGGSTFTLSSSVTLVAKYHVLATYSISFVNEGLEVDSLQQIVSEGSAAAVESRTMLSSCSEYLFEGWSTTPVSGTVTTEPTYYNFATAVTGPVTLYAVYSFVDTSTGGSNDYTLVTNKADLTAGSKVIIGSGAYVMGAQASNNRPGLTTGASTFTKSGNTITLAAASTAAVLTVGIDGTNYTFGVDGGYLYAASSSSNLLRTQSTLDNNGKWALGAINGTTGECASVVAQGTNSRETMGLNTNLFSCYDTQSSYGKMFFYKNTAAAEYTTNPICSPMIVVDQTDVEDSISTTDFVIGLGGTATSTGHTVFSKNCTSASYVQPVIYGVDKAVFSVNWTRVYLDNGAMDTLYTVSYSPVTGTSHTAYLYFETDDHAVISDTIPLYGEVCTAVVFTSHSATENTITINWTAPSAGSSLRVWNTITVPNACESAPQPFDQTYVLGTEVTRTITGLKASGTYYYQATSGTCVSEQRTITTSAASGVPALTASSSTIEFIREIGKDTTQSVSLSGVYMNNASVSVAITGAGAAAFSTNASITLDGTGKGTLSVTYTPTSSQTFVAVATITYTSGCETKTVVVNLVGNVPGIDMVEINEDATGFVIHTDFQGTPDIVLSQEVEHAGTGKVANDLFFSKYYEAYVSVKLVGIYNGTRNPISLDSVRVVQKKAGTWSSAASTEVIRLDTLGLLEPGKEIILYSSGTSGADTEIMNCVKDGIGFDHEGWYPVGAQTALKAGKPNLFGSTLVQFAGDKSIALQRQRTDGTWAFLDLIGAGDSITSNNDSCIRVTTNDLNDAEGWYCADGINYKTKEVAPLSTNRHLLIRKNTVVDGLTAVAQNTLDMETLCAEWEGVNVPTKPDTLQSDIACEHFSYVAEFNYDGYYSSFERVNEGLVTFTPAGVTAPGDWVGTFDNPTTTFQDTLRCYNLQISILRYYNTLEVPPLELTKAQVQAYQADAGFGDVTAQAIIAALDTVEAASVQWRVPIIVKSSEDIDTYHARFTDLSVDTCQTCDVVILNGGTLRKSANVDDRDSVRSVIVYNGGRLIVPDGRDYVVNDLQVRAKGDSVGAAFIEGNLMMKNPRVVHDKRVENDKPYFFTLPYDCPISRITQMNGKTMGPYGATWVIKYYDGAQRIENKGLSNNWKIVDAGATLKAGIGYVLYISSDVYKYVRFPMVATATFTEKNTGKSMDVTQYGQAQAYGTDGTDGTLGWNNVGWNLVGNPYVSYFMAQGAGDSIMNGSTILKGRYLPNGGYNEDTWLLDDTENVYITVPDATADGGYSQRRVSLTQLDPFISFFVQADRTGSLDFATSSRESVAKVMRAPVVDYNEVVLNFDVAGKADKTTIILNKERNTSYEIGQDLLKWKGKWGKTPYLYSFDNTNNPLAFNATNYDEAKGSVPVAFYMPTTGARYTFSIDRSASKLQNIEHVYLLRNGSVIADLLTTNYTATDLAKKAENKEFAISIQRAAEVVTPVNPTEDDVMMPRAITERHEVRVEQLPAAGTVIVMDAVGRTVANRTLTGADNMTFELPVDGVYTITVMTPARNYTLKTVIR